MLSCVPSVICGSTIIDTYKRGVGHSPRSKKQVRKSHSDGALQLPKIKNLLHGSPKIIASVPSSLKINGLSPELLETRRKAPILLYSSSV